MEKRKKRVGRRLPQRFYLASKRRKVTASPANCPLSAQPSMSISSAPTIATGHGRSASGKAFQRVPRDLEEEKVARPSPFLNESVNANVNATASGWSYGAGPTERETSIPTAGQVLTRIEEAALNTPTPAEYPEAETEAEAEAARVRARKRAFARLIRETAHMDKTDKAISPFIHGAEHVSLNSDDEGLGLSGARRLCSFAVRKRHYEIMLSLQSGPDPFPYSNPIVQTHPSNPVSVSTEYTIAFDA
jgi:hypothetical protein